MCNVRVVCTSWKKLEVRECVVCVLVECTLHRIHLSLAIHLLLHHHYLPLRRHPAAFDVRI